MEKGFDDNLGNERIRTHKVLYIVITAIVIFIAALVVTNIQEQKEVIKNTKNFYFLDISKEFLKSEERYISGTTHEEILEDVLETLKGKPISEVLMPSIPENIEFGTYWIDNKIAYVNIFYKDMEKPLEDYDILMCRGAIVWTLTELDFIDGVCLIVNGKPIMTASGEYIGVLTRDDFVIDASDISTEPLDEVMVKLYFANSESTGLEVEQRKIVVNPNQELGRYVVEELIKGPLSDSLKKTVPPETKVLDIKVVDKVCYVDFSSDFILKHSGGTSQELLTIYSIVNSLTSLDGIEKVQFLIDGEKQTSFKGTIDFSVQFTATDLYLQQQ